MIIPIDKWLAEQLSAKHLGNKTEELSLDRAVQVLKKFDGRIEEAASWLEEIYPPELVEEILVIAKNQPSWKEHFPSYDDLNKLPEPKIVIRGILTQGEILANGALPKHGKTWIQLSIAKALLTGEPWLGKFETKRSDRIVYLVPECGIYQIKKRLVLMRMMEFVGENRLFIQPRPMPGHGWAFDGLADAKLLDACEGADVFLDTAVRFIEGDESVESIKKFSNQCLDIASVARSVVFAHHSTKGFEKETVITMQNVLRGSGDLGAMVSTCIGIRQLDEATNLLHVEVCGARDADEHVAPFHIEGRPHINEIGDFKLVLEEAGPLSGYLNLEQGGRPKAVSPELMAKIRAGKAEGLSNRKIAEKVNVSHTTVNNLVQELAL